jgi:hypothetical protein
MNKKTHPIATDYRGWMDLILHKIIASLKHLCEFIWKLVGKLPTVRKAKHLLP